MLYSKIWGEKARTGKYLMCQKCLKTHENLVTQMQAFSQITLS